MGINELLTGETLESVEPEEPVKVVQYDEIIDMVKPIEDVRHEVKLFKPNKRVANFNDIVQERFSIEDAKAEAG
ncbi:MAG: hypothetical protein ACYS6K_29795, partial [Planctomycetota bacterium]